MRKYILILCLSFISGSTFSDKNIFEKNKNFKVINNNKIYNINKSVKAVVYSALIPGSGQFFVNNNETKGLIFFGLEMIALAGYRYYLNQAENYKKQYQNYGNKNWSFVTWCANYYDWSKTDNEYFLLFANDENLDYPHIWEDSHHIDFTYTDNNGNVQFVSSSSSNFQNLYNDYNLSDQEQVKDFYNTKNVI